MTNADGTAAGPPILGGVVKGIGQGRMGRGKMGFLNPAAMITRKLFNKNKNVDPNAMANATTTDAAGMTENIDPTMQSPAVDPNAVDPAAMEDPNAQVA